MVEKVWKIENGTGHWMLYLNGNFVGSCEDAELSTTLREIESNTEAV